MREGLLALHFSNEYGHGLGEGVFEVGGVDDTGNGRWERCSVKRGVGVEKGDWSRVELLSCCDGGEGGRCELRRSRGGGLGHDESGGRPFGAAARMLGQVLGEVRVGLGRVLGKVQKEAAFSALLGHCGGDSLAWTAENHFETLPMMDEWVRSQ